MRIIAVPKFRSKLEVHGDCLQSFTVLFPVSPGANCCVSENRAQKL